jgi:hypothetical protein
MFFRLKFHFWKTEPFLQSYISKIIIIVVNGIAVIKVIHTVSTDAFYTVPIKPKSRFPNRL